MTIRPLANRILVDLERPIEVSDGGIHLLERSLPYPRTGKVVAVGSGKLNKHGERIPIQVKPGDRVLLGLNERTEVDVNGGKLYLMSAEAVGAILPQ